MKLASVTNKQTFNRAIGYQKEPFDAIIVSIEVLSSEKGTQSMVSLLR